MVYPNLPSAQRPVDHGADLPVPSLPQNLEDIQLESSESASSSSSNGDEGVNSSKSGKYHLINQRDLNDLVKDLELSQESAELLFSTFKSRNLLAPGVSLSSSSSSTKDS